MPRPRTEGHKYDRGHVGVITGGMSRTGAARLAARAALRSGAGLVTLLSPPDALLVNAAASLAIMVRQLSKADELKALVEKQNINALVLGPGQGVGAATQTMVLQALRLPLSCVLDADALTSFENDLEVLAKALSGRHAPAVLTPHEGEFVRLFKDIQGGTKEQRCLDAARKSGAVVVLKGAETVIAAPDGRTVRSAHGSPYLATAGSGDVLAGLTAGLLAQGMEAFLGACAAVYLHGEAARRFGPGLIAEDLPDLLPEVLKDFLL